MEWAILATVLLFYGTDFYYLAKRYLADRRLYLALMNAGRRHEANWPRGNVGNLNDLADFIRRHQVQRSVVVTERVNWKQNGF